MRFIDEVNIRVVSGHGGAGCVSFRREKFVPLGGPDGGNGGRGGDVALVATHQRGTLMDLRHQPEWRARSGQNGGGRGMDGASGPNVEVLVPVGTRIIDADTEELLADLTAHDQRYIAVSGGDGGFGNAHYKSSRNRSPEKATPGWPGAEKNLRLELVLMADVGLLGFPNAGKSTFISRISAARPKVADYPFTTLVPQLGVVDLGTEGSFVVADMPGLIRGAAEGAGLGHRFLRHVSRTRVLLHLLALGDGEAEAPLERYRAIRHELEAYDPELSSRPEIVVLTKADLVTPEVAEEARQTLQQELPDRPLRVISSATGQGVRELKWALWQQLQELGVGVLQVEIPVPIPPPPVDPAP